MVGTIVQNGLYANYGICCQRSLENGILQALFHCREVVLGNGAADHFRLEYVRRLQIAGR